LIRSRNAPSGPAPESLDGSSGVCYGNAMINRIKSLAAAFGGSVDAPKVVADEETEHLAAAVLMVEAATLDGSFDDSEADAISRIAQRHFGLNEEEAASLLEAARETHEQSSQLLGFTRSLKEAFPFEERVKVIEMLWEVAYADGVVHHYEANLIRRINGLLYVSDRDSGDARKRVAARLGISP
jgi:uncharacterized tellurite resistance protein B-like protein